MTRLTTAAYIQIEMSMHLMARAKRALRGLLGKPGPAEDPTAKVERWLRENPDIIQDAKRGFDDIDAGRYTKASRPDRNA